MRRFEGAAVRLALFFVLISAPSARAALGDHLWSQGWDVGGGSAADADGTGHVVATGVFFSSIDLGGGAFTPGNVFGGDVFLARFDSGGNHVWSQQFTPGGFGLTVEALTAAPDGSIYLAGTLQNGDVDFGGGVLSGNGEFVLAAFEPDGSHRWSFVVGAGFVRALDASDGTLACTGYTYGSLDFGGGTLTSAGDADAFVGVLDADGTHRYSAIHGDGAGQGGMGVAVDSGGGIVLAVSTESALDLGGGTLTPAPGSADLCVAAYDSLGVHQWSWIRSSDFSPGAGILMQMDVAVSAVGRIAVVGQFQGSVDMGGSVLSSAGSDDAYLAVYESDGSHVASRRMGGTSGDGAQGVRFDSEGNVAIAGNFLSSVADFGGAPLSHAGGFGSDWFVTVFDGAGTHLYAEAFTGNGQYTMLPRFTGGDDLLLTGTGAGGTDFGGGTLASTGLFLAQLDGAVSPTSSTPDLATAFLRPNHPNPFNPRTTLRFRLTTPGEIRLEVFDAAGRRVRTLARGPVSEGEHAVVFDGRDDAGRPLASGVYRYRLSAAGVDQGRSMVLVR